MPGDRRRGNWRPSASFTPGHGRPTGSGRILPITLSSIGPGGSGRRGPWPTRAHMCGGIMNTTWGSCFWGILMCSHRRRRNCGRWRGSLDLCGIFMRCRWIGFSRMGSWGRRNVRGRCCRSLWIGRGGRGRQPRELPGVRVPCDLGKEFVDGDTRLQEQRWSGNGSGRRAAIFRYGSCCRCGGGPAGPNQLLRAGGFGSGGSSLTAAVAVHLVGWRLSVVHPAAFDSWCCRADSDQAVEEALETFLLQPGCCTQTLCTRLVVFQKMGRGSILEQSLIGF